VTHLLQNPVYAGKVKHRDKIYDGAHQPIISQKLFDLVQSNFQANRSTNALGKKSRNPSLLTGMITDPDGKPMTPTHATKGSKRFRYYVTRTLPGDQSIKWRMPAGEIERLVVGAIAKQLGNIDSNGDETAAQLSEQLNKRREMAKALPDITVREQRRILVGLQARVEVHEAAIKIYSKATDEDELASISLQAKLVSKGSDLKLAIAPDQGPPRRDPDPVLLRLIAHAFAAQDLLLSGKPSPMIAEYSSRHVQQLARLSYLAPNIISAIVDGTQPVDLTGRKILRIGNVPLCWKAQRKLFGFN